MYSGRDRVGLENFRLSARELCTGPTVIWGGFFEGVLLTSAKSLFARAGASIPSQWQMATGPQGCRRTSADTRLLRRRHP